LKNGNVWVAEAVARELPRPLPLDDALKLTYLYAEKEQWEQVRARCDEVARRYLDEKEPAAQRASRERELEASGGRD
jgi:hypothetical protein